MQLSPVNFLILNDLLVDIFYFPNYKFLRDRDCSFFYLPSLLSLSSLIYCDIILDLWKRFKKSINNSHIPCTQIHLLFTFCLIIIPLSLSGASLVAQTVSYLYIHTNTFFYEPVKSKLQALCLLMVKCFLRTKIFSYNISTIIKIRKCNIGGYSTMI